MVLPSSTLDIVSSASVLASARGDGWSCASGEQLVCVLEVEDGSAPSDTRVSVHVAEAPGVDVCAAASPGVSPWISI